MVRTEIGTSDAEDEPGNAVGVSNAEEDPGGKAGICVCDAVGEPGVALLAISTTGAVPSSFSIRMAEYAGYGQPCSPWTSSKNMHWS